VTAAHAEVELPELELRADLEGVRAIGPWLGECLAATASQSLIDQAGAIELALHEVAVNVIEHSLQTDGTKFVVRCTWSPATATATFTCVDHGPQVDADALPSAPESPQVGGYGLMIVEQVADSFEYQRTDGSTRDGGANEWTLTFVAQDPA